VLNTGFATPRARPSTIALTGDGALLLERLAWRHWASRIATATRVIKIRNCRPDCATADHTYVYRVQVSAHQVVTCPNGRRQYAFLRYAVPTLRSSATCPRSSKSASTRSAATRGL
jgi:hypothetical protein